MNVKEVFETLGLSLIRNGEERYVLIERTVMHFDMLKDNVELLARKLHMEVEKKAEESVRTFKHEDGIKISTELIEDLIKEEQDGNR